MKLLRLRKLWEKHGADLMVVLIIALFFSFIFWRPIYLGEYFLAGDPFSYWYPLRIVAWNMIREGTLPLWTPLALSGYPLLSMAQIGLGYPLTWAHLFLPGHMAGQLYVLAPYLLTPIFTYAYTRTIGCSRLASLLAGLAYSYGGMMFGLLGMAGLPANGAMWLPLILLGVERARTRRFAPNFLLASGAYAMSVLNGFAQCFVYIGAVVIAYGAFLTWIGVPQTLSEDEKRSKWLRWERFRPLAASVGALALAAGVSAFQILESLHAQRMSLRSDLSFEIFSQGSFPFSLAWRSLVDPLNHHGDVSTFVPALVFGLALMVCVRAIRYPRREPRILFWLIVAVVSWFLILGSNTPLHCVVFRIPFFNSLRVPSRHALEWTFSLSVLSAYGWDALRDMITRRPVSSDMRRRISLVSGWILLALAIVVGVVWWKSTDPANQTTPRLLFFKDLSAAYVGWKAAFTILALLVIWQGWRVTAPRWRSVLLLAAVTLICFVEPFILITRFASHFSLSARRFDAVSPVTKFLQQYPAEENRVFTHVNPFVETYINEPRIDPANLTMRFGLQNVAGYEPMIFKRYFVALGAWDLNPNVHFGVPVPDSALFSQQSHVLDLLNTTYVASFPSMDMNSEGIAEMEKEGIRFTASDSASDVPFGPAMTLAGRKTEADQLVLVTIMTHSANVSQGAPVARISIKTADGQRVERELRAGVDTAEWAHEYADVRPHIRHELAPVFDSRPGGPNNSFNAHRYWSRIDLGAPLQVETVEINKLMPDIGIALYKASLFNKSTGGSAPLAVFDPERWQQVYNQDGIWILHNRRALPRAWLVTDAVSLDANEALKRIRGQSNHDFDPRRTALIEIEPHKLPKLSGLPLSPDSFARIVKYEPNRMTIETKADQPTILVISELHYPGWVAMVDGVKTPIHTTDFLLRGVPLPAGPHRIEMSYRAPAARTGAIISLLTLLFIIGLAIYSKRSSAG